MITGGSSGIGYEITRQLGEQASMAKVKAQALQLISVLLFQQPGIAVASQP